MVQGPQQRTLSIEPMIMGILNVTPDSFSDGGQFLQPKIAISHAVKMVAEGASIIDVGGESTRPGALPVPISEQVTRVVPVIEGLREVLDGGVRISIDAREPEVAARALDAGANMINDISGGANPEMLSLAAGHRIPIVLMHMQGSPESMQIKPDYVDVVKEIWEFLNERADLAISAGISPANIIIDPGIGFGKTRMQNLDILRHLEEFVTLGYVVALGTSRKRFMGSICQETTFKDLVGATCATTVIGVRAGVRIFRVHDVRENRQAMEVALAAMGMKSRFAG